MEESVPFLSGSYLLFTGLLVMARGLDFLSTWIATPHLVLEGNPVARKLGWRWGAIFNLTLCATFGLFPVPAVAIATASALVAAHNLEGAWLMRSMGEAAYASWIREQHRRARPFLMIICLLGKTGLWCTAGAALILSSKLMSVSMGVGCGIVGFALHAAAYSTISVWRSGRMIRHRSP
jgi:hypothetical protein